MRKKSLYLHTMWDVRNKIRSYALKFYLDGQERSMKGLKMFIEGDKYWDEGCWLQSEGEKMKIVGKIILSEMDKIWCESIVDVHGNIKAAWKNYNKEKNGYECHLETGEVFKP